MGKDLLRPGGRYNVRRTGHNQYTMSLPMPADELGMTARTRRASWLRDPTQG